MINSEDLWRVCHRIEAAADKCAFASQQMETAAHRLAFLLEDGYGGNGLRLIELLEKAQTDKEGK